MNTSPVLDVDQFLILVVEPSKFAICSYGSQARQRLREVRVQGRTQDSIYVPRISAVHKG